MKSEHVVIPCDEIKLEGVLHLPDGDLMYPAVVVCHPHPLYGGNMDNNVVMEICRTLVLREITALRINFRGVGGSGGTYGEGIKEQDDVKAALDYLCSRVKIDKEKLGLAGYSFGGAVALSVAQKEERVGKLILISPALGESEWDGLIKCTKPKLVLLGSNDMVIPNMRLNEFEKDPQFQIIKGADHFWLGFEEEISKHILDFISKTF